MTKTIIPEAALQQHVLVLGKTRSGKSSTMRGLVENLLDAGEPVAVVDPKGDWWGLKSSADGKSAGYPVVIFGGSHADVPLNAHAGAHVAELVATGNRPCIIDLGGWMVSDRTRFFIDFASTLFRTLRGRRWLVLDEVHNFVPQGKILDPDAGKMLHWGNRLASEGLGKGLRLIAASQRPQKVHKDFVTSAETLIAMRVIHPLDRNAIKEWIDGCPDAERGKEVLATLASMPRGEGWVWSPEIGFGPKRVAFPKFSTYDSFKEQPAEAHGKLKGWAEVDLAEVTEKLASVVKEAEANDPKLLRAEIARLKTQAARSAGNEISADALARERASAEQRGYARGQVEAYGEHAEHMKTALQYLKGAVQVITHCLSASAKLVDIPLAPPAPRVQPAPRASATSAEHHHARAPAGDPQIGNSGLRRMLIALAQRPQGLNRRQLGVRATLSSRSGTFDTYLSKARTNGWIEGTGDLRITEAGLKALGGYTPLPAGRELLAHWLGELGSSGAARMLQVLADAYPKALSREDLGAAANLSDRSGTFDTYLSRLRTLELITGRGEIRASEELFDG